MSFPQLIAEITDLWKVPDVMPKVLKASYTSSLRPHTLGDYGRVEGARRHAQGSQFACFTSTKVPILTPVELQELSGFANAAHQHAEGLLLQV